MQIKLHYYMFSEKLVERVKNHSQWTSLERKKELKPGKEKEGQVDRKENQADFGKNQIDKAKAPSHWNCMAVSANGKKF